MLKRLVPLAALCLAACGGSSSSPSAPSTLPTGTGGGVTSSLTGVTVDAISGTPLAGLEIVVGGFDVVRSDASGQFAVSGAVASSYPASIRGTGIVTRQTRVLLSSDRQRLSLIPSTFDLAAFDEMFRSEGGGQLQRWRTPPALVIVASAMEFGDGTASSAQAGSEQMSDDEIAQIVTDLSEGLSMLTGGTWSAFGSVTIERPSPGQTVEIQRYATIVVGRYTGVDVEANGTVGYGRWATYPDGTVVGGTIYLDRNFDRADGRRRLLRIHELGHALGYQHVASRPSIMNPQLGAAPTAFDLSGATIAFDRQPGNRSPDVDPGSVVASSIRAEGPAAWSRPVP